MYYACSAAIGIWHVTINTKNIWYLVSDAERKDEFHDYGLKGLLENCLKNIMGRGFREIPLPSAYVFSILGYYAYV